MGSDHVGGFSGGDAMGIGGGGGGGTESRHEPGHQLDPCVEEVHVRICGSCVSRSAWTEQVNRISNWYEYNQIHNIGR